MREGLHAEWYARQVVWQDNILRVFRGASADMIVEGKRWYPDARTTLEELRRVNAPLVDSVPVAAICAVLSPRITWQSNLEGVRRILKAVRQGSRICPTVAGVRRNVEKAWDIANGASLELVTGPKVSAFYANLKGDYQRVTIDVWAARAAGVSETEMSHLDRTRYVYLERAYQTVAAELDFLPAELQAICWIVVRGKGE